MSAQLARQVADPEDALAQRAPARVPASQADTAASARPEDWEQLRSQAPRTNAQSVKRRGSANENLRTQITPNWVLMAPVFVGAIILEYAAGIAGGCFGISLLFLFSFAMGGYDTFFCPVGAMRKSFYPTAEKPVPTRKRRPLNAARPTQAGAAPDRAGGTLRI